MEFNNCVLAGALALALVACGGGGGGTEPEPPASRYHVSGSVSGLNGSVAVSVNGGSAQLLSANGTFSLAGDFADGATLGLTLSEQPFTQRCSLNHSSLIINGADIRELAVNCANVGSLSGSVRHYQTGAPIAAANLTLYAAIDGQPQVVADASSDQTGQFTIDATGISSDFQLVAAAAGFVIDHQTITNSEQAPAMSAQLQLLPADQVDEGEGSVAIESTINGLVVLSLPANSLVDGNGQAWSGPVTAEVGVIDPSADPGLLPGDFRAIAEDGDEPRLIESFGALSVSLTDGDGNLLQLAPGALATLRIPLAERLNGATLAANVPLYWFDEARGLWIEEGQASLASSNGRYYYQGEVGHFTVWNADDYITTAEVQGCVEAAGQPLAGAQVVAEGRSYIGRSAAITDADGQFVLPVRAASEVLVSAIAGSQSNTVVAEVESTAITLSTCLDLQPAAATIRLTWGANPHDLDSHLVADLEAGSFELYFDNPAVTIDDRLFSLDVDDTTGFGPELVTLSSLTLTGHYHYVVHLYTGSGSIAASPARVMLNLQGQAQIFTPPAGSSGEYWHVFTLDVDDNGGITLIEQQHWLDDEGYGQLLNSTPQTANKSGVQPRLSTANPSPG